MKRALLGSALLGSAALWPLTVAAQDFRVLVFTKTAGHRHGSIPAGIAAVQSLGAAHGFAVDATEDAAVFTDMGLAPYRAVIWLNTTRDVLGPAEEGAFRRYVEGGGGFVGVHSAADTEQGWPWYGDLLGGGAWFRSHPPVTTATLVAEDRDHPSTLHLLPELEFTDEWYNFQANPRPAVRVLLSIDEDSYDPGPDAMGDHPIAWYHGVGAGRSWYTNLGHSAATYTHPAFTRHLLGGILWAAGAAVFANGFETGDTAGWPASTP